MKKENKNKISNDLIYIGLKISVFLLVLVIAFGFIFGIKRCNDDMMSPAYKNSDLAIYYRLQGDYQATNVNKLR